jgi:hypothetical protein
MRRVSEASRPAHAFMGQNVVGVSHCPDLTAALLLIPASVRLGVLLLQARAPETVLPANSGGGKAPLCSTGP